MVTKYGMSEAIGPMTVGSDQEVFVGMEFGQSRDCSETLAAQVDAEVKRILCECYDRAMKLLSENRDKLEAVAEALLERDTLNRAEFEAVMRGEPLPEPTESEKLQPAEEETAPAEEEAPAEEQAKEEDDDSDSLPYTVEKGGVFLTPDDCPDDDEDEDDE
jgi:ATP-dependent Zn proteases